jgi:hypothetical protein
MSREMSTTSQSVPEPWLSKLQREGSAATLMEASSSANRPTSSPGTFSVARRARGSSMAFAGFVLRMSLGLREGLGRIPGRALGTVPIPPAHGMDLVGGKASLCSRSSLRLVQSVVRDEMHRLVASSSGRAQLAFDEIPAALSRSGSAHKIAERRIRDVRHGCDAKCRSGIYVRICLPVVHQPRSR